MMTGILGTKAEEVQRKPELGLRLPLRWFAIAAATRSRPRGSQAGNQRNFAFRLDARHLRQFFFSRRFRELSSTDGSCRPNLREEIAVVVAVENQLGLGLWRVGLRR